MSLLSGTDTMAAILGPHIGLDPGQVSPKAALTTSKMGRDNILSLGRGGDRWGWNELSYVCRVDDGNVSQLSLSFHPDHYKDFFFHLDRDIRGDVFVGQSYNPSSPNITIHVTARASSSDVLEVLALGSWPTPELSMMDASVYINTPSETSRKEILSKGCTFVRVEILFPANMTSYESLRIRHQERGDVRVRMGGVNLETTTEAAVVAGPSVGMTVDQLDIAVYDGWVTVRDVVVSDELKVVSKLGGIKAQADVNRRVTMEAATDLTLELGSSSSVLDVKVTSRKLARVIMKTPYVGHVEMMTTTSNGSMPVVFVPRSKFVEQKSTAQTLIGYIPDSNNEEPMYLPRIEISGSAPIVELLA
ncbi:hypothetical protein EC991_011352 [Linnemannia zychae]|nr:hypothetical protein EC991_011352 [Linnemannia zychae]